MTTTTSRADRRERAVVPVGLVVGVAAVAFAGILVRWALESAEPLAIAFWRCAAGAVALAPFGWRAERRGPTLDAGLHGRLRWAGLALAVHFGLFIAALDLTSVGSAVLFATMTPVFTAIGGARFLDEVVSPRTRIGIAVSMVGALIVGASDFAGSTLGARALLGDAAALASAVAVSIYFVIGRRARGSVASTTYSAIVFGWAAAALLVACVATGAPLSGYSRTSTLALVGIVIGPQLLGHSIFNALLSRVSPTTVSITVLSEPVLATLLAIVLLDELPSALFWVGAPIVAIGIAIGTRRAARDTGSDDEVHPISHA